MQSQNDQEGRDEGKSVEAVVDDGGVAKDTIAGNGGGGLKASALTTVGNGWECDRKEVLNLEILRSRLSPDFTNIKGGGGGGGREEDEEEKKKETKIVTSRFTDTDLIRHLRARDQDVVAAEKLFRKMVAWRRTHHMDSIVNEWEPPVITQIAFPGFLLKGAGLFL